ncbi:MAG: flagellar type III secretion system protein FlhB [Geminicoccaceae bacterium]
MASEHEAAQERSLEPTAHKLEQARRRGAVPQSREVTTVGLYLGLFVALAGLAGQSAADLGQALLPFLEQPDQLLGRESATALAGLGAAIALKLLAGAAPLVLLPALGVVLALTLQQSVVVAGERLSPRWSRLSILSNARQRFGVKGLVEFLKSLLKLLLVAGAVALVIGSRFGDALALTGASARVLAPSLLAATSHILLPLLAVSVPIAAADYLWQRFDHLRRQRMTPQELKEEQKHTEVDAHLKQARRDRAVAIATNRMLREIPRADVIVTNPTHYAVALRWDRTRVGSAPHCIAKGADQIAHTIRSIATEHGIAIVEDRPLARSLYDLVDIGDEIRVEHYRAVAAALHYAMGQRRRTDP